MERKKYSTRKEKKPHSQNWLQQERNRHKIIGSTINGRTLLLVNSARERVTHTHTDGGRHTYAEMEGDTHADGRRHTRRDGGRHTRRDGGR